MVNTNNFFATLKLKIANNVNIFADYNFIELETIAYKNSQSYRKILLEFGYEDDDINNLTKEWIYNFIMNFTLDKYNPISYFIGYILNKFRSECKKCLSHKTKNYFKAISLDDSIGSLRGCNYHAIIGTDEDIGKEFSIDDIYTTFVLCDNPFLNSFERKVLYQYSNGYSLNKIAKMHNLSYRQTSEIFKKALNKVKENI